jgi:adenylate cyclase
MAPLHGARGSGAALATRARLVSGLTLFAFVTTHLLNHSLGLISLDAMEAGLVWFLGFWRNPLGTFAIYAALSVHLALNLHKLYERRSLTLGAIDVAQVASGIAIPFLLAAHLVGTRGLQEFAGVEPRYALTVNAIWNGNVPDQAGLIALVWLHGCIGVYFWLRLRPWFTPLRPWLFAAAVLLPVLGFLGFLAAAREVQALRASDPDWWRQVLRETGLPPTSELEPFARAAEYIRYGFLGLLGLVVAARGVRAALERRAGLVRISYPGNRRVEVGPGPTLLEISRRFSVPHASVCGGRGRCSTCRVRIDAGLDTLLPPSEAEARVLARVGAPPVVRLACQIRPTRDLDVTPLLAPDIGASGVAARNFEAGAEREIVVLFADLRGFTALAEGRLPYDIVFVLNQYFRAMGSGVEAAGGQVDKFIGDGVMALFGVMEGPAVGARQALQAARDMGRALDRLNHELASVLRAPLQIGIGIHAGAAIVGEMGYGHATHLTAIGDTVNVASRLEGATKEFAGELVFSLAVARLAGISEQSYTRHEIMVRGRGESLTVGLVRKVAEFAL